ncbi:hypothetical protein [Pseudomonas sp. HY7a-MNA-CIBAN-0227]|uniref:hypothetical protein n=1 Tax=Pseudomonas sp. HY7a-MNA-CIBAN-0227 TaxID=3140474 RepID=UPI0033300E00
MSINYSGTRFETPNSDADIEKYLLKTFRFTKRKDDDDGYDIYPDEEIHSTFIAHSPYQMAIENFKYSIDRIVRSYESKGIKLTSEQNELVVNGLLSSYKNYSLAEEDRETYTAFIMDAVLKSYGDDDIFDPDNKLTGFSPDFSKTKTVIDYLKQSGKFNGPYGKLKTMTKAASIANDLHDATSIAYKSLCLELKQIDFRNTVKRVSSQDHHEELREAVVEYLGK